MVFSEWGGIMAKVTLIFVGGSGKIDKLITDITGGEFSHVAGFLFDSIYESTGMKEEQDPYPGVWLHRPDKYDGNPAAVRVEVEVPNLPALQAEARRLLGRIYGYTDCVKGGLYDLLRIELPSNDYALNCSETWTRLLRAGGCDPLHGVPADVVTPADLYRAVTAA